MPRRITRNWTGIKGTGKANASEVWRIFQCSNIDCDEIVKVSEDEISLMHATDQEILFECPRCHEPNNQTAIGRASRWKYCRVCEWLQPLENFHRHTPNSSSFRSGRQLECKMCKNTKINPRLNPLRTSDQFRESAERRRLFGLFANEVKVDSKKAYEVFKGQCFNCDKKLEIVPGSASGFHLDHTLPAKLLWPLVTGPTLLCSDCNNAKHDKWPSEFYTPTKLKRLSFLTGIRYDLLAGPAILNPEAVERILSEVDSFMTQWIRYPEDLKEIRQMILQERQVDIFERASTGPDFLRT